MMPVLKISNKLSDLRDVRVPEMPDEGKNEESQALLLALDLRNTVRDNLRDEFSKLATPPETDFTTGNAALDAQIRQKLLQLAGSTMPFRIAIQEPDGTMRTIEPPRPLTVDEWTEKKLPEKLAGTFTQLSKLGDRLSPFQQRVLQEFQGFSPSAGMATGPA